MTRLRGALLSSLLALSWAPPAVGVEGLLPEPASNLHFDPFQRPVLLAPPSATDTSQPQVAPEWAPQLRAVMVAGSASMVNVDGSLVGLGEEVEGHRLVEVTERRAVFERDGVLRELEIE